jgi:hypothetical protein
VILLSLHLMRQDNFNGGESAICGVGQFQTEILQVFYKHRLQINHSTNRSTFMTVSLLLSFHMSENCMLSVLTIIAKVMENNTHAQKYKNLCVIYWAVGFEDVQLKFVWLASDNQYQYNMPAVTMYSLGPSSLALEGMRILWCGWW